MPHRSNHHALGVLRVGVFPQQLHGDGRVEIDSVDTILTAERLSGLYGYGLRQLEDRGRRCFIPE